MASSAKGASGMRGHRTRDLDGQLRQKRGDTHMGTVERQYDRDFKVRSDMRLDTYLKQVGKDSLDDVIKDK